jgi:hypothetical protein
MSRMDEKRARENRTNREVVNVFNVEVEFEMWSGVSGLF